MLAIAAALSILFTSFSTPALSVTAGVAERDRWIRQDDIWISGPFSQGS